MTRRLGRSCVWLAAAATLSAAAHAQPIAIDGTWGNAEGCLFATNGDRADDGIMVLTPDRVETYVTLCEWVQVSTARDGAQVATGLCAHEGEDYRTVETYIIEKDAADPALIRIRASNGEPWGEVRKCP